MKMNWTTKTGIAIALLFFLVLPISAEEPAVTVKVEKVCPMDLNNIIEGPAEITPYAQLNVAAKLMGYITSIVGEEGQSVSSGEVVLTIDDRDILANLHIAEETLKEATAAREAATAQRNFAEKQMNRMQKLVKQSASTQSNLDQTEAAYLGALGGLNQALAKMGQAQAAIANAKVMLSYTKLTTPFDGVIVNKNTCVGNLTAPGQPLLTIDRKDKLYVTAAINENDIASIKVGGSAQVFIEALNKSFDAEIFAIIPAGDRISRTFRVKVVLENKDGLVKPGMYAKLFITRFSKTGVIAVPKTSVVKRDGKNYVFLVNPEEKKAHLQEVEFGLESKDYIEVKKGVPSCAFVVTQGKAFVADGDNLHILDNTWTEKGR
jgi:RND family efflux transporter MFP subunit